MRPTLALLVTGLLLTGCARTGQTLGAGDDVGLCVGWSIIDGFDEPDIADLDATLRWADGVVRVIDRIDTDVKVDDDDVPDAVVDRLATTAAQVTSFADTLRDQGTDGTEDAWIALTAGPYAEATGDVTTFVEERC